MQPETSVQAATWIIAALAAGGVVLRPWGLPEALWAVLGAAALAASQLLPWPLAIAAVGIVVLQPWYSRPNW